MVLGVAGTIIKSATYARRVKNSREIVGVSTVTFGSKNEATPNRPDRKALFPWNSNVECLLELDAEDKLAFVNDFFIGYKGRYTARLAAP